MQRFFVLDLDRCLIDTAALHELFVAIVVENTTISRRQLHDAVRQTELSGGSFDSVAFVQNRLNHAGKPLHMDRLLAWFVSEAGRKECFMPGARDVLKLLSAHKVPYGIMTYGDELWQRAKLQAAGMSGVPALVTAQKEKGKIIASWQQPNGIFRLPAELSASASCNVDFITLVDDKAISFHGLPSGTDGLYVLPLEGDAQLRSQRGSVPSNVTPVRGLTAALPLVADMIQRPA